MKTNLHKLLVSALGVPLAVTLFGCSGGGSSSSPPASTPAPTPVSLETDAVKASILDDAVVAKVGTKVNVPIVFSAKKIGDTATNFSIDNSDLPPNIKIANQCNGNVTNGNGCFAMLSYTGAYSSPQNQTSQKSSSALDVGILPVRYHFSDSSGKIEHGVLAVPYQSVEATPIKAFRASPGVVIAKKNRQTKIPLTIASADGCPINNVSIQTLEKNNDVTLSNTNDGHDGLLYEKLAKSVPLNFIIHPRTSSVNGLNKVHFRLSYDNSACSVATAVDAEQKSSLRSTAITTQDYTVDYSVAESSGTVIATVTPNNNIATTFGESLPVNISFSTSSGTVTNLSAQAPSFTPSSEASFWTVNSYTLPCLTVNSLTTSCTISTTYAPTIANYTESGVAQFPYTYSLVDNGGKQVASENGVVLIDFSTTSINSIQGVTQTSPVTVGTTGVVTVNFTTNFGVASNLVVTSFNGSNVINGSNVVNATLPTNNTGLSLASDSSLVCPNNIGVGGGCSISFNYTPPTLADPISLNTSIPLTYTYTDNLGNTDTASTTINLQPVYPMVFVAAGNWWNFNLYGDSGTNPQFGVYGSSSPFSNNSGVYSGIITTGLLPASFNLLPNLPGGGNTAYTGVTVYDDNLYISGKYSNITVNTCDDGWLPFCIPGTSGDQYGSIYQYSLQIKPTQALSASISQNPDTNNFWLLSEQDGVSGFNGVAIGNNSSISYGGPYLFTAGEAIYSGPIFGTAPGQLSTGGGTSVGVCSFGSILSNCLTNSEPNSSAYSFYGNYLSNGNWQNVADLTLVWGWVVPSAYSVDSSGNFYVGQNTASDPEVGSNYSNVNLIKCTPSISGPSCTNWWTVSNSGGAGGPWIQSVTSDSNYVYYGDSTGNSYECSLNSAQSCTKLANPSSGSFINAMAADGNGNLFVGDAIGHVWNPIQSGNVFFSTIGGANVSAMTYYAPTATLYIADSNGMIYACPVSGGALAPNAACQSVQAVSGTQINSIAIASFN